MTMKPMRGDLLKKLVASSVIAAFLSAIPGPQFNQALAASLGRERASQAPQREAVAREPVVPAVPLSRMGDAPEMLPLLGVPVPSVEETLEQTPSQVTMQDMDGAARLSREADIPSQPIGASTEGSPSGLELAAHPEIVALPPSGVAEMSPAKAKTAGDGQMAPILHERSGPSEGWSAVVAAEEGGPPRQSLLSSITPSYWRHSLIPSGSGRGQTPPPAGRPSGNSGSGPSRLRPFGFLGGLLAAAAGAGAVWGLNAWAVSALPGLFGSPALTASWGVASAILWGPLVLLERYQLAKRDSSRLRGVKLVMDLSIGALLGAGAVAFEAALQAGGISGLFAALPAAASAHLPVSLSGLIGLMALPTAMTISYFAGFLIRSAETGEAFRIPRTMTGALRFPSYPWVVSGVVFALWTGYSPIWATPALLFWTFFGDKKSPFVEAFSRHFAEGAEPSSGGWRQKAASLIGFLGRLPLFDAAFLGLAGWAVYTQFASPLVFLVLAFAPERASNWTERLLTRLLPKGPPAPSSAAAPLPENLDEGPARWPKLHYWLNTGLLLAGLTGFWFWMGTLFGLGSFVRNLAFAAVFTGIQVYFSPRLIKLAMQAKPADESRPEDKAQFRAMRDLLERANAGRSKGKKPYPMPEMINIPAEAMPGPNAFATGPTPFKALVGVGDIFKDMLAPESLRAEIPRLMSQADGGSDAFKVFRMAIRESVPGIGEDASPEQVSRAVAAAPREALEDLGYRVLRGVLGHEFGGHVLNRDMLVGGVAGAYAMAVAWAAYSILWVLNGAKSLRQAAGRLLGKEAQPPSAAGQSRPESMKPEAVGAGAAAGIGLVKAFVLLWGPTLAAIMQMTTSRQREGAADESGAGLSEDPEALALGLGLLTAWRPEPKPQFKPLRLPFLAALRDLFFDNPFNQLSRAGQAPSSRDNFVFDLFVTHPDTGRRIELLYRMARALKEKRDRSGGPSAHSRAPPGAGLEARGGLYPGAWGKIAGLFRVLPDKDRNRELWKFFGLNAILHIGVNFIYTAMPGLMAAGGGPNSGRVAAARGASFGAQAAGNFASGPFLDGFSPARVLGGTGIGRFLATLPVVFVFFYFAGGHISFDSFVWLYLGVTVVEGFLQSLSITAGNMALNRFVGADQAHYNKANAVYGVVSDLTGTAVPIFAGLIFIPRVDRRLGIPHAGDALSVAVFSLAMLAFGLGSWYLKIPRDPLAQARGGLAKLLKGNPRVSGVGYGWKEGRPVLIVQSKGETGDGGAIAGSFAGFKVELQRARPWLLRLREGWRLIFSDRFLRATMVFSTLEYMAASAFFWPVLNRYIRDILDVSSSGLLTKDGVFGLYLAVMSLGPLLASWGMMFWRDRPTAELETRLFRFKERLTEEKLLEPRQAAAAAEAAKASVRDALAEYRRQWKSDPTVAWTPDRLQELAFELSIAKVREAAFPAGDSPEEARLLLLRSGWRQELGDWARGHFDGLMREARREALTGLDFLERQWWKTTILYGAGSLIYAAVFFTSGLAGSVGFMFLSALLQAPAVIVGMSLTQRVLQEKFRQNMGDIYAAQALYANMLIILGLGVFGYWLMGALPARLLPWMAGAVLGACAALRFAMPFVVFKKKPGLFQQS